VSAAWVVPVRRADGTPAVLKLGKPHMEARDELAGLRFWDGDPTVRVLEADEELGALLLERCEPGTHLRSVPEPEQDVVIAGLLRRLWRRPAEPHPFRPLTEMTAHWLAEAGEPADAAAIAAELHRTAPDEVLLATDLHAGNVLRAEREPWLVIDPKPFVGDPAYDATQHLLNRSDPDRAVDRFAELLGVDAERVRLWLAFRRALR
jgi:streptomycin 6-kinase